MRVKRSSQRVETVCHGIGYQGRSVDDLCDALRAAGVRLLVDVRERAWSQRPQYRKQALQSALATTGIEYVHCKSAGNPFRPKAGEALDFAKCASRYAAHLRENPIVLDEVQALLEQAPAALFCFEADAACCHRSVLMRALSRRARLRRIDL